MPTPAAGLNGTTGASNCGRYVVEHALYSFLPVDRYEGAGMLQARAVMRLRPCAILRVVTTCRVGTGGACWIPPTRQRRRDMTLLTPTTHTFLAPLSFSSIRVF